MRSTLLLGAATIALNALAPVAIAQSTNEPFDGAIRAADAAAVAAEHAAEQARAAMESAQNAAKAARAMADAARQSTGRTDKELSFENENLRVLPLAERSMSHAQKARMEATTRSAALSSSVANGTNGSTLKSTNGPDLQLVASAGEKTASLAWSIDISGQSSSGRLGIDQLTMTATSKLNGSGNAPILGLKGFSNGTELKISYTHYGSPWKPSSTERSQVTNARTNCLVDEKGKNELEKLCDPYNYEKGVGSFVAKYNRDEYRKLLDAALPGSTHFYGLEFTGNQAGYEFLNRTTFKMGKKSHFGYSATVFGGFLLDHGLTSLGGSFSFGREYTAGDDITICQNTMIIGQTQCITAPDGSPTRNTSKILAFEGRHAFAGKIGEIAKMAIGGEFSFDLNSKAYSLDVPLYIISDDKGQLRGGVRGTYVSQKDAANGGRKGDFGLSLFVGVPFSIFTQ
jgi:hypothetical protein